MKECINCGSMLEDDAVVCRFCTQAQNESVPIDEEYYQKQQEADRIRQAREAEERRAREAKARAAREPGYRQYQPPPPPPPGQGQAYGQPGGYQQPGYQGRQGQPPYPQYRNLNRVAAGVLAIVLGAVGIHKFYMGKITAGIVYVVFSFTGIPFIIGVIEGIVYLSMDDNSFREKYCRLR